ncbi:oligopeptide transport system ATP-binding protein [Fontibacillus panacisegetis]|uniref:Oligopeptide transport system ATP-binding protein n=1 Tax=Fontibacillus panacisegetis TaxID=670482 RepID=A0A1G7QEH5_9BACL|nr:ATP-binding cassette domain-containing protein [Fontibacillus panacisegetis]SDF96902.1 oligopeptide transport system ATP-binding protein [Fontibacillus panacisegetis]
MEQALLEVSHLSKIYKRKGGPDFSAVKEVSFSLSKGEALGIVGESGSGKTTVAKMVAGMLPVTSGSIMLDGQPVESRRSKDTKRNIQYIFQDPVSSLNPRLKIKDILAEPLKLYFKLSGESLDNRIHKLLDDVGIPKSYQDRYPKELSGGQCQRIGIARALAAEPSIMVCDEPTSALDMTIQSQILELLQELQRSRGISYIFIAHGLEVIYTISNRVLVMKQGEVVETGATTQVFHSPQHAYTQTLIQSIPKIELPYFEY